MDGVFCQHFNRPVTAGGPVSLFAFLRGKAHGALATAPPLPARIDSVSPRGHADARFRLSGPGRDLARRSPTRKDPPATCVGRPNRQKRVVRRFFDNNEEGPRGLPRVLLLPGPDTIAVQPRGHREALHLRQGHPERGHRVLLRRILRVKINPHEEYVMSSRFFPATLSHPPDRLADLHATRRLWEDVGRAHAPRLLPRRRTPRRPRPGAGGHDRALAGVGRAGSDRVLLLLLVRIDRILDVGCGIGGSSRHMARRWPGCVTRGITLAGPGRARERARREQVWRIGPRFKSRMR